MGRVSGAAERRGSNGAARQALERLEGPARAPPSQGGRVVRGVRAEAFLLDLALDAVARQRLESIDEEDPIEVIHLVLEHPGLKSASVNRYGLAGEVVRLERHPGRAGHEGEDPGNGQAAFLGGHLATARRDDGIDERAGGSALRVAE